MEELYNELMKYLSQYRERLGVTVIDEDWGQLEAMLNGEDTYPVTFPCLLIGFGEAQWSDVKPSPRQRGSISIITRLAFDCYDDTHSEAGQQEYAHDRNLAAHKLHCLLQGMVPECLDCSSMSRYSSRTISLPHGIKVYEAEYRLRLTE